MFVKLLFQKNFKKITQTILFLQHFLTKLIKSKTENCFVFTIYWIIANYFFYICVMAWRPWMSCAFNYDLSQQRLQEVSFFSSRCHNCRNFSKFIMNKTCNFQCKVTYIKITNTLISVLRRKSLKESHDLFVYNSLYFELFIH